MVVERRARQSIALGNIKTITLNDLQNNINSTIITKNGIDQKQPIRVLVTVHSVKLGLGDLYERGLGLWVGYIIQKYLKVRGVKFRLYMKSILESTKLKSVVGFIKKNKIDYLIPSDVTGTFVYFIICFRFIFYYYTRHLSVLLFLFFSHPVCLSSSFLPLSQTPVRTRLFPPSPLPPTMITTNDDTDSMTDPLPSHRPKIKIRYNVCFKILA